MKAKFICTPLLHSWYCRKKKSIIRVRAMVLNATFNNISVISWLSVLLKEEKGENDRPAASH